ncbi:hypothetical protein HanRHA438_Chr15g0705571 [Helianthus annuus]|nr:hypothetical protein HanRHA438_Chr15g0705571 [Helianthus annuus]
MLQLVQGSTLSKVMMLLLLWAFKDLENGEFHHQHCLSPAHCGDGCSCGGGGGRGEKDGGTPFWRFEWLSQMQGHVVLVDTNTGHVVTTGFEL